jgi:hypothetical protein
LLHLSPELSVNACSIGSTTTCTYYPLRVIRRLLNLPCCADRGYDFAQPQRSRRDQAIATYLSKEGTCLKAGLVFVSFSLPQAKGEGTPNRSQPRLETFENNIAVEKEWSYPDAVFRLFEPVGSSVVCHVDGVIACVPIQVRVA